MDKRFVLGSLFGGLLSAFLWAIIHFATVPHPKLIGVGCENSGGELMAFEEDHFPMCVRIEGLK